jgi:hypothetical protein
VTGGAAPTGSGLSGPLTSMAEAVASWTPAAATASALRDRGFAQSPFAQEVARLERAEGPDRRAEFLRGVLTALVVQHRPRIEGLRLPASVKRLIEREYVRIEKNLATAPGDALDLGIHSMRCDFRIVAFGRIPTGVEHIEIGGLPRALVWKGGGKQALQMLALLARAGGARPFYVGHLTHGIKPHAFLMAYTPDTQAAWQRNVAACLQMNPHLRGFLASSWLYDPQLARVSPHLSFLREGSLAHGAVLAHIGPTEGAIKNALARSPERQRLYEAGEYVPTSYAVVWTRQAMLKWAGLK